MKKSIFFVTFFVFLSINLFSQKDFTFCYSSIAVTIFDGGNAEMVRYNSSGSIVSKVTGTFDLYGKGSPTEVLKIQFQGNEYRYDLIRDGFGSPSKIFDNQGRSYNLCKTSKSKSSTSDYDYEAEFKKDEAKRASEKLRLKSFAKYLEDRINELYLQYKKGMKPSYVVIALHNLEMLTDFSNRLDAMSISGKALYNELKKFCDKAEIEIEKNNSDPNFYNNTGFLKNYTNTKGIFVKIGQNNNQIFYLNGNDGAVFKSTFKGYIQDGKIYDVNKILIATIEEKEYHYLINYDGGSRYNKIALSKSTYRSANLGNLGLSNLKVYHAGWAYYNEKNRTVDDNNYFYIDSRCPECAIIAIAELTKMKRN
jgi:hypothetical protein